FAVRFASCRFYINRKMNDFYRFATFKTPCRITENREERSGQEKEGQEKEEIGACPASPRGEMSLGDSSRRTLFTFFIPLIPFHLPANPVCEPQRFGISAERCRANYFERALERDPVAD